jgi:hypothetical protein
MPRLHAVWAAGGAGVRHPSALGRHRHGFRPATQPPLQQDVPLSLPPNSTRQRGARTSIQRRAGAAAGVEAGEETEKDE